MFIAKIDLKDVVRLCCGMYDKLYVAFLHGVNKDDELSDNVDIIHGQRRYTFHKNGMEVFSNDKIVCSSTRLTTKIMKRKSSNFVLLRSLRNRN